MPTTAGYQINQVIYEDPYILIGHAYPKDSARQMLVKMVKESDRIVLENAKLMNEYRIASRLEMEGILRPILPIVNGDVMALEYTPINGVTLRRYFALHPVSVCDFIQLSLRISSLLLELHRRQVLHLNIRPETILIQPTTKRVYFAGFGYAVSISEKQDLKKRSTLMEASPPYMSPEQTGRINHRVDHRADLYSLGVTFFEMLTGKLPFQAADPLGWSHAHMAIPPALSSDDVLRIPQSLLHILFKLLAKDPEKRYQNAWELRADFEASWMEGQTTTFNAEVLPAKKIENPKLTILSEVRNNRDVESLPEQHTSYPQLLDIAAIMQSSDIFVRETDERQVVRELMSLILKQAGAEKAWLFSVHNGKAKVEWIAEVKLGQLVVSHAHLPLEVCTEAQKSMIAESLRSHAVIRINGEGKTDGPIPPDLPAGEGSVLCLPILIQEKVMGMLYLENNQTQKAFVAERYSVLRRLSSQVLYLTKNMVRTENPQHDSDSDEAVAAHGITLTEREKEIVRLMAGGLSNKEMAQRLIIAPETVKAHMRNIYRKLKVSRRIEAVMAANQLRLLDDQNTPFGG
ncbi:LuxR C-terminal-related transcriptional regulator [Brevibacillus ruminantium]|uniref:LuxR C-terminal-related transcriptional regulator n=1 Tax=Brevibacillus ruminantium TaxID=2950604 RepID=A0ABY4WDT0_9BACL|nr:LuxR C-terminal-related transcriptional regulator [Brevibacillus ruminantium]USG65049.1 LuxR C-terminal-related transcriptional regulator [Brevibacillus ruminantium]